LLDGFIFRVNLIGYGGSRIFHFHSAAFPFWRAAKGRVITAELAHSGIGRIVGKLPKQLPNAVNPVRTLQLRGELSFANFRWFFLP
jgi:hypothetical protein